MFAVTNNSSNSTSGLTKLDFSFTEVNAIGGGASSAANTFSAQLNTWNENYRLNSFSFSLTPPADNLRSEYLNSTEAFNSADTRLQSNKAFFSLEHKDVVYIGMVILTALAFYCNGFYAGAYHIIRQHKRRSEDNEAKLPNTEGDDQVEKPHANRLNKGPFDFPDPPDHSNN